VKKPFSILLLLVFAFNLGGYYVFFWAMRHTANKELVHRLDANDYSSEEVIELQIPFTLPYPIFNTGFERVDGKFEHEGEIYKLVKQKLVNDTLYIVCLQDKKEMQITSAFKDYSRLSNDMPASHGKHSSSILNKLIKDYNYDQVIDLISISGWSRNQRWCQVEFLVTSPELEILSPPPKV
jgi:hypothetical protein